MTAINIEAAIAPAIKKFRFLDEGVFLLWESMGILSVWFGGATIGLDF
jgi:hypothetical protein